MLSNAIFEATMLPVKRIDEISEWSGEAWFAPPEFIPRLSPGVLRWLWSGFSMGPRGTAYACYVCTRGPHAGPPLSMISRLHLD